MEAPAGPVVVSLIPPAVMAEAREKAATGVLLPVSRAGGVIVVVLWVVAALLMVWDTLRAHLS